MKNNLSDRFLSIDLEMNQPSGKIIQIGACIGSRINPEKEFFSCFVNPEEPLDPDIIKLTGIYDKDVVEARNIRDAGAEFLKWLRDREKVTLNPVTWGGGDTQALVKQAWLSDAVFGRRWIDTKTIWIAHALANNINPVGGLRTCMKKFGLPFRGTAHNALDDAMNTLVFFFGLLETLKK